MRGGGGGRDRTGLKLGEGEGEIKGRLWGGETEGTKLCVLGGGADSDKLLCCVWVGECFNAAMRWHH